MFKKFKKFTKARSDRLASFWLTVQPLVRAGHTYLGYDITFIGPMRLSGNDVGPP